MIHEACSKGPALFDYAEAPEKTWIFVLSLYYFSLRSLHALLPGALDWQNLLNPSTKKQTLPMISIYCDDLSRLLHFCSPSVKLVSWSSSQDYQNRWRETRGIKMLHSNDSRRLMKHTKDLPAHYTFTIKSFSFILESSIEKIETDGFEAAGSNWKLELYPNGNNKLTDNRGHVSLYLAVAEPEEVSFGWEALVFPKFFLYDRIRDRFRVFINEEDKDFRFHRLNPEGGLDRLVSHAALNDLSNGYLVDDCFSVGVDLFAVNRYNGVKRNPKGGSFSLVKRPENGLISWKIDGYSSLEEEFVSEVFTVEGSRWEVMFYPNGDSRSKSGSVSFHLLFHDDYDDATLAIPSNSKKKKVFAKYTLRLRDQGNNRKHHEVGGEFMGCLVPKGCFHDFISQDDLKKGYLVNDSVDIEVEFHCISST